MDERWRGARAPAIWTGSNVREESTVFPSSLFPSPILVINPGISDEREKEKKDIEKQRYKLEERRKAIEKKEGNIRKKERELGEQREKREKIEETVRMEERYQRKKRMEKDREFREEEEGLRKRKRNVDDREKEVDEMKQSLKRSTSNVRREGEEYKRNIQMWNAELARYRDKNTELTRKNILLEETVITLRNEVDEWKNKAISVSAPPPIKKQIKKKNNNNKKKEPKGKRLDPSPVGEEKKDDCDGSIRSDAATLPSSDDTIAAANHDYKLSKKNEEVFVSRGVGKRTWSSHIPFIFFTILISLAISTVGLPIIGQRLLATQSVNELD